MQRIIIQTTPNLKSTMIPCRADIVHLVVFALVVVVASCE